MAKSLTLLFLLCFGLAITYGQSQVKIYGWLTDSANLPLEGATAMLMSSDTIYSVSTSAGYIEFRVKTWRTFSLLISSTGFETYTQTLPQHSTGAIYNLGKIAMKFRYSNLTGVEVISQKPIVEKGDTTEYRARFFSTEPGDQLEDLLKKLPGLEIGLDGRVSVLGKPISSIMVNGKEFFGGDIQAALQNLPADIIEKVQVIDDFGDEARLTGVKQGEPAKVLNIELKKDKRNGEFGNLKAAGGDADRYVLGAMLNSFAGDRQLSFLGAQGNTSENSATVPQSKNQSIASSFSDKWARDLTGQSTFEVSSMSKHSESAGKQQSVYDGESDDDQQSNSNGSVRQSARGHFNLQFQQPQSLVLRVNPSLQIEQNSGTSNAHFAITQVDSDFNRTTVGQSNFRGTSTNVAPGATLYFEKLFKNHRRRFNLSAAVSRSTTSTISQNATNSTTTSDTSMEAVLENFLIRNAISTFNLSNTLNYYEPVGKKGFVNLEYSFKESIAQQALVTSSPDSESRNLTIIDSLSSKLRTVTSSQQFHLGYMTEISGFNLTIGADALPTAIKINYFGKTPSDTYHQVNYSPMLVIFYAISKRRHVGLNYSGHSNQPQPLQLQKVSNLTNPQFPVVGNPELKPEFTHSIGFQYEQSSLSTTKYSGFSLALHYSETTDKIISNVIHPKNDGSIIQETTFLNTGGFYAFGGEMHVSFPPLLMNMIKFSETTSANITHSLSMLDSSRFPITSGAYIEAINATLDLKKRGEIDLFASYGVSTIRYSLASLPSGQSTNVALGMNCKINCPAHFVFAASFAESLAAGLSQRLTANPSLLNFSLQKPFYKRKQLTVKISAYNLLNSNVGLTRYVSPTTTGETRTNIISRFLLLTVAYKFSRFHK